MPSTRRRNTKRRSRRQQSRRSRSRTYLLLAGAAIIAVIAVGLIILLDQGAGGSSAESGGLSPEKSLGAADAKVVVVEYSDFQCPYCQQFATGPERQLREEYVDSGTVRFVYRHLAFIGDESTWAAEASECANEQGRFWDYHDKLFDEQAGENQGAFSKNNLKRFAADLGLDAEQFNQCLDSGEYRDQVREDVRGAQRRQINSTPSILVNDQLIRNGANYQVLQMAIEAALAQP
jgi:protein-disulfide isomerase